MKKYRIIKETKSKTKKVNYYIEKYKKFLFWEWWSKLECSDFGFILDFETENKARKELDKLTEKTIVEVITYGIKD